MTLHLSRSGNGRPSTELAVAIQTTCERFAEACTYGSSQDSELSRSSSPRSASSRLPLCELVATFSISSKMIPGEAHKCLRTSDNGSDGSPVDHLRAQPANEES